MSTRLEEHYKTKVIPGLKEQFAITNPMQVPRIKKIVINMGVGDVVQNSKAIQFAEYVLTNIAGQKPSVRRSKKSIAAFKLREGLPIGCMVTLRNKRMYEFLDRFISVALPRTRDFRGVPKRLDGMGNYNVGIEDSTIFPEVNIDKMDKTRGMDITIVTSAENDDQGRALLTLLGMPFRK
jgi:large subunit ribosomal protein L5